MLNMDLDTADDFDHTPVRAVRGLTHSGSQARTVMFDLLDQFVASVWPVILSSPEFKRNQSLPELPCSWSI